MTALDLVSRVCAARGITLLQIRGPARTRAITAARHEAMWILREATDMSLPEIGRVFYGRDHTTVLAAVRKIQGLVDARPAYGDELRKLARVSISDQFDAAIADCSVLAELLAEKRERVRDLAKLVSGDARRAA